MQQKATQNCVRFLTVNTGSILPSTLILRYLLCLGIIKFLTIINIVNDTQRNTKLRRTFYQR
jgi:hypothetical protein